MNSSNPNRIIFNIAKEVYEKNISKRDGINKLVESLNMNRGSAQMIIVQIFPKLLDGEKFTRTLSVDLFDSFLQFIKEDYGIDRLKKSLSALKEHIDYIKEKGDSKVKLRIVLQRYWDNLATEKGTYDEDEFEQNEITKYFKKEKSRSKIAEELKNTEDVDDEKITVNQKSYKRNNKTIALIKILRNFECQICGLSILKKDGTKYVEAAHITPKSEKGKESAENIILLCPNHHKEFDLGDCTVIERNINEIRFVLNGKNYNVSLASN